MVAFREVSIRYRHGRAGRETSVPAVESASAECPSGAVSAIVGPSGCGKTSLLRAAAGLIRPDGGQVVLGHSGGPARRPSLVFQHFGLLPWRTVEGNAALPLEISGLRPAERKARVAPLLEELGLWDFRGFYPGSLSGGMMQRVALARALVSEPDILLMDEPFSSLDALTRESAQDFLIALWRRRPMTIVLVTHSIEEAAYLSGTVFVMTGRNPGTVSARFGIDGSASSRNPREGDFRSRTEFLKACGDIRAALRCDAADGGDGR